MSSLATKSTQRIQRLMLDTLRGPVSFTCQVRAKWIGPVQTHSTDA